MKETAADFYKTIEEKFIAWAKSVEDIRAAFIIGSRARNDHPADEWSDLDIIFFATNPHYYLHNHKWLENIGSLWTSFLYQTAGGDSELLTLFSGGWQADFVIHSHDTLKRLADTHTIPDNFYRGVKVIIDKDDIAKSITPKQYCPPKREVINENAFIQVTNIFWFASLYMAKQILRNELWVAKARDVNLKELLLQVIEWHEKLEHGAEYDTWHAGRFLCEWTSKDIQAELGNSFGHFDQSDSWQALLATVNLFKHLAQDISNKMNYVYPYDLENNISTWINANTDKITNAGK